MMEEGQRVRARVLKVANDIATLGVYHEGEWVRLHARTHVPLEPGSWIMGRLTFPDDGAMVLFKLEEPNTKHTTPPPASGLDLEA